METIDRCRKYQGGGDLASDMVDEFRSGQADVDGRDVL